MNNKREFGITLKDAKHNCKKWFGKLPRPGREIQIDTRLITLGWLKHRRNLYLVNCAGHYYLREWINVNPEYEVV